MNVPKEMGLRIEFQDVFCKCPAADKFDIIFGIISCVKVSERWAMGDQDVSVIRDSHPLLIDHASINHPRPVTISRNPRRSPEVDPLNGSALL
jgi:hypothetical protein